MSVIDGKLQAYIDDFYKGSSVKMEEFRAECEKYHVPIIRRETQSFLSMVIGMHPPKNILEIGTGVGYSSVFLAGTVPGCTITTLELINKRFIEAYINVEKFGFAERIKIIEGDASETLVTLSDSNETYDFVFIDSAKSRYREFFEAGCSMMPEGGIIVCDNVLLEGRTASDSFISKHRDKTSAVRMREFIEFLKSYEGAESHLYNIGDGLTVSFVRGR